MISTKPIPESWQRLNRLYYDCSTAPVDEFQEDCQGLRDFIAFDSNGTKPLVKLSYFQILEGGKSWFNYFRTNLRENFGKSEPLVLHRWPGLLALREDYRGELWALKMMIDWYPWEIPEGYFDESVETIDVPFDLKRSIPQPSELSSVEL